MSLKSILKSSKTTTESHDKGNVNENQYIEHIEQANINLLPTIFHSCGSEILESESELNVNDIQKSLVI